MTKLISIIPARGGSKGIKRKNIINFCNKPLLYWTINRSINSKLISSTWVTSDNNEILKYAKKFGANAIKRPARISKTNSKSEDAILHAISHIEKNENFEHIIFPQVTSPIRHKNDFDKAIRLYLKNSYDSLFSAEPIKDYFIWEKFKDNNFKPMNYSIKKRSMRQSIKNKYHENGSFYIFKKNKFLRSKVRLFGKIGVYKMDKFKSIQIDENPDIKIAKILMKNFILND